MNRLLICIFSFLFFVKANAGAKLGTLPYLQNIEGLAWNMKVEEALQVKGCKLIGGILHSTNEIRPDKFEDTVGYYCSVKDKGSPPYRVLLNFKKGLLQTIHVMIALSKEFLKVELQPEMKHFVLTSNPKRLPSETLYFTNLENEKQKKEIATHIDNFSFVNIETQTEIFESKVKPKKDEKLNNHYFELKKDKTKEPGGMYLWEDKNTLSSGFVILSKERAMFTIKRLEEPSSSKDTKGTN